MFICWFEPNSGGLEKPVNISVCGFFHEQKVLICRKHWCNSTVRRYYIGFCRKKREYGRVLKALDESMVLEKEYRGLVAEYSNQKSKYRNRRAMMEELKGQ